jgi:uncharacterized protein YutE (UPF0331/DUF86 family)
MVRPDVVGKKLARAAAWLDGAEERLARPVLDAEARDLAAFYLFLAIQESIDLAAHWVADARWGSPDEAGATFELLRGAVGLRNRIAHGYSTVDHGKVQSEYQGGVATLRTFLSLVAEEAGL